jgi:hypothetical protein
MQHMNEKLESLFNRSIWFTSASPDYLIRDCIGFELKDSLWIDIKMRIEHSLWANLEANIHDELVRVYRNNIMR